MNPYCNQWNVAITKIICLNSTCNLRRAYFAIKQINSISIVQKTIAKYHGNFAIKIQGPAKFTSNIQVNVSHRYIKWIILLWLLNKMKNINEWNWKDWCTPPIFFWHLYFYVKYLGKLSVVFELLSKYKYRIKSRNLHIHSNIKLNSINFTEWIWKHIIRRVKEVYVIPRVLSLHNEKWSKKSFSTFHMGCFEISWLTVLLNMSNSKSYVKGASKVNLHMPMNIKLLGKIHNWSCLLFCCWLRKSILLYF